MARKIFVKVQWEFSTAGHLVFWKPYLSRLKILKNYAYTSSENLSTTIRNLYLESLGISKQSLNTLLRFPGFLWIFIGSSLSVWELECFLSVENIEISLKLCPNPTVASTFNPRQYLQSSEIPKQISYVRRGIKRTIPRKLVKISDFRVSSFLKTVPGSRVSRHFQASAVCVFIRR